MHPEVVSDRPGPGELPLPPELVAAKRRLLPDELVRYRKLGRDAAEAMTEVLSAARPEWTEWELAGAGANALWRRGIEPMLTLGTHEYDMWDDGWTVVTRDRRRTAQFEHTLAVTETGAEILTLP